MNRIRFKKLLKWFLIGVPLVLLLVLTAGATWLFNSETGAKWLWTRAEHAMAGQLSARRIEGDLASGMALQGMEFRSPALAIYTEKLELQVSPGIWPLSLNVGLLSFTDVTVTQRKNPQGEQDGDGESDIRETIEAIRLPVALRFDQVEIHRASISDSEGMEIFSLDRLNTSLSLTDSLEVESLRLASRYLDTDSRASLSLSNPFVFNLEMEADLRIAQPEEDADLHVPLHFYAKGDLDEFGIGLRSTPSGLDVKATVLTPLDSPEWNVSGGMDSLPSGLVNAMEELQIRELSLSGSGGLKDWHMEISSAISGDMVPDTRLNLKASGEGADILIKQAVLQGQGIQVEASGRFSPRNDVEADVHTQIHQLNLSHWIADWPDDESLAGELDLAYEGGNVSLSDARFVITDSEIELHMQADVDVDKADIEANLSWQELRWPIPADSTRILSPIGELSIQGSLDEWQSAGSVSLKLGDYPVTRLRLEGSGSRNSAGVELLDGQMLGGRIRGSVEADWLEAPVWSAQLSVQGVDPEPVLPGWPGQLDADLLARGDTASGSLEAEISRLEGQLRGQRFRASGGLTYSEELLAFRRLDIRTDELLVRVDGSSSTEAGVAFSANGQLPGDLLSGASGQLELDGRYTDLSETLGLEVHMQALDLTWEDLSVQALAVDIGRPKPGDLIPSAEIKATGAKWQGRRIDEAVLQLEHGVASSFLSASIASEKLDLVTRTELKADDWQRPLDSHWSGKILAFDLLALDQYGFELKEPAVLDYSPGTFSLASACLNGKKESELCASFSYRPDGQSSAVADIKGFPLDFLTELQQLDVGFEQVLSGQLLWNRASGQTPTGSVDLTISPGRIVDLADDESIMESKEGSFNFLLRNGNLEAGALDIAFPGIGFVDFDFEVMDFSIAGEQRLQGRLISQLSDIELLGQLALPALDETAGSFESDISIGGNLADPILDGDFKLLNGLFYYAPLGFRLEDVNVSGLLERNDRGKLEGDFRLGEGSGSMDGRFQYDNPEKINLNLAFSGKELLLINNSNLKVVTDAEFDLGLGPQGFDIDGKVRVPSARLTPANLVINTINDSEDLVIINDDAEAVAKEPTKTPVFGKLVVELGDDIKVKIPGVETAITGRVDFDWTGDPIPLAKGNYYLDGVVDIYGPRLEFVNSSIAFPDVPADNPLLNIRAEREIFGNTQIRSAGVQVTGSVKRPVIEAFTIPVTNEDRAWTLLVTGTDFDQGQGVGGFDVGTYIAPKLYVSYGISLFDDENVISARYDLKRGFGIKVTSGQRETGLDISYTIDK